MSDRIALLVHNRYESDPRVTRHARASLAGGYRVAVLSVIPPSTSHGATARWGHNVDGALVFESSAKRRSLFGAARLVAERLLTRRTTRASQERSGEALTADRPGNVAVHGAAPADTLRARVEAVFQIVLLLRNNYGLFRQFRGVGAALVHANDLNVLPAGYLLARYWRAPLVYDSHELWTELDVPWSPTLRKLLAMLERSLIRVADAAVTVNSAIADELARRYDVPRPTVVMNCAELPDDHGYSNIGEDPGEIHPVGTPPEGSAPLRVIYQGMFHQHSGLLHVIDAAALVPEVMLSIRGSGALRDAIDAHIRDLGLGNRVRLLDPIPMRDLVPALRGFDVGVVPYLPVGMNFYFCSPNKLFEYMTAGLAVVASDLPILREVVTNADCGFLYDPGNAESLAAVLSTLAHDAGIVRRFQVNAQQAVQSRYNARHEENRLLEVYGRVLAGRHLSYSSGVSAAARTSPRTGQALIIK